MSTLARLELTIDVVGLPGQRALALPSLTPAELASNILEEFREIEHLGTRPGDYQLVRATDGEPLEDGRPLSAQIAAGARLRLEERPVQLPDGAARPSHGLYLRERSSGQVFQLAWLPAVIGRADASLPENELIAADLAAHPAGQRVSRRHARLIERDGHYLVERLSPNPVAINDSAGRTIAVEQTPVPIHQGDTLLLVRSEIALSFIIRDVEPD
jgi:hypothetical protein